MVEALRVLSSELVRRAEMMWRAGKTYEGKRDLYDTLGYKRNLYIEDYWERYLRGGLAKRAVDILPKSTWRGGAYVFEKDDPNVVTQFEAEWDRFAERTSIWSYFERLDKLAGVGQYAGLLIGAPGELQTELPQLPNTDAISFLRLYKETDLDIQDGDIVTDAMDARYGLPMYYTLGGRKNRTQRAGKVHWSRILHYAPDVLDDEVYGTPRLEAVWNLFDDLEKVTGGGSEAFWIRANNITQFDIDKDLQMKKDDASTKELQEQIDELQHNIRRYIRTRGVTMETQETKTADFKNNAEAIEAQIAGTLEIPVRILIGSERGEQASTQDRFNFAERIADRRDTDALPRIVRPFVQRLITYGALRQPKSFSVWWPEVKALDQLERGEYANILSTINKDTGSIVFTTQEVRGAVGYEPITEDMIEDELDLREGEREVSKEMMPDFANADEDEDEDVVDDPDDDLDRAAKQLARKRAMRDANNKRVKAHTLLRKAAARAANS